jgi:hypothetical protein
MILPAIALGAALAQPAVETRSYCVKGKCEQVQVSNKPSYGGLYGFRERPGGRVFVVYAGPLGAIPRQQLQQANGFEEKPTAHFELVSAKPSK